MIKGKKLIVYDFETNGFWSKNNQPIQVSCKIFDNGTETVYSSYIKCPTTLSSTIVCLTGITDLELELKGKEIKEVFRELSETVFVGDFIAVGHNILSFDNKFFNHYMELFGFDVRLHENNSIDTMCHFRKILSGNVKGGSGLLGEWQKSYSYLTTVKNAKLSDMADYFGIKYGQLHNADKDVELNANVLFKLIEFIQSGGTHIVEKFEPKKTVQDVIKTKRVAPIVTITRTSFKDMVEVESKVLEVLTRYKKDKEIKKSMKSIMTLYKMALVSKEKAIEQIQRYIK